MHLSASSIHDSDRIAGLNNGADSYLTEPIEPEVLVATMRALLRARQAEEALRRSNQDLRELTNLLSHDMREPLRAMTIYAHLLADSVSARLTPEERQFMEFTLSGARQMSELIEGVLLFSRTLHEGFEADNLPADEALQTALSRARIAAARIRRPCGRGFAAGGSRQSCCPDARIRQSHLE